jgi:transcriptional regulator of nitric oxide reductase
MSPTADRGKSLRVRLRRLFGRRARAIAACILLLAGGLPIRPEELEEQMCRMSNVEIVQALEHEQQPSGDPPDAEAYLKKN